MKRNFTVLLTILICSVTACQSGQKKDRNMDQETKLKIETTAGDIIVKLYNETRNIVITSSNWRKRVHTKVHCSTVSSRIL